MIAQYEAKALVYAQGTLKKVTEPWYPTDFCGRTSSISLWDTLAATLAVKRDSGEATAPLLVQQNQRRNGVVEIS